MTDNVTMEVINGRLVIVVDLSKRYGPSATAKTVIVGSSHGSKAVPGNPTIKLNLSVYTKE